MKEAMERARVELPPKTKINGEPGKKNQVFYKCASCGNLFKQTDVRVDHIEPVVPLYRKESQMTYDQIARGIFCKVDNLQVLCNTKLSKLPKGEKSCHAWKTQKENWIRDQYFGRYAGYEGYSRAGVLEILEKEYTVHKEKQLREVAEKAEKRKLREDKLKSKLNKIK
jgi:hypothetical protein